MDSKILITWARALRVYQWPKNVLLWVPVVTAHNAFNWLTISQMLLATLIFCLTCSAVYLINDLIDITRDRAHPIKQQRPLAAGKINPRQAKLFSLCLLVFAALLSLAFLPLTFTGILLGYFVCTLCYSLYLKKLLIFDLITLAILYSLRILAGSAVSLIPVSQWLLVFSIFIFFGFATLKRVAELTLLDRRQLDIDHGRAYQISDLPMLSGLGVGASLVSVLVLCLYISSPSTLALYAQPDYLWLIGLLLLYWQSRLWMLAHRGEITGDPILFASKDLTSYLIGSLSFMIFYWAI